MTAPSQEAVSAIPDAEVLRKAVYAGIRAYLDHHDKNGLTKHDKALDVAVDAARAELEILLPDGYLGFAVDAREEARLLATRPTREEIRDEALEERIREDERDRLMAYAVNMGDCLRPEHSQAIRQFLHLRGARMPEYREELRAALRSRTPAPSRNQD